MNTLCYSKALKLNQEGMAKTTAGTMINLVASDTLLFERCWFVACIVPALCMAGVTIYLMYSLAGEAVLVALAVFAFAMVGTTVVAAVIGRLRMKVGIADGIRLSVWEELLTSIQVIKMYCWEATFLKKLVDARKSSEDTYKQIASYMSVYVLFFNYRQALLTNYDS